MKSPDLSVVIAQSSDDCGREPIHTPGAIQPHGYLIGLDPSTLELVTRSQNLDVLTASDGLRSWLPAPVLDACRKLTGERYLEAMLPEIGRANVHCFRSGATVFCEFESYGANADGRPIDALVEPALHEMAEASDLRMLSQIVTRAIRALSGFERVMVYRFSADGHGDVVGESLVADWDQSFLGLQFPASDIPPQARALYARTTSRWMPSREYEPVVLVPQTGSDGKFFDLSSSQYRDVSPVHRLYQRNIGTDGSMSVSVMQNHELWGLIIGHHRKPHRVPDDIKRHIVQLTQAYAMRLDALTVHSMVDAMELEDRVHLELITRLATADEVLDALIEGSPNMGDLFPGSLGIAVVWHENGVFQRHVSGQTPEAADLAALVEWVRPQAQDGIYSTSGLADVYAGAKAWTIPVAGLLAGALDDDRQPMLLVFRPEVVRTVTWAGRPEKVRNENGQLNLPRRSFERWEEIQHGLSAPWTTRELKVARDMVRAINEVLLRHQHRMQTIRSAYESAVSMSHTDGLLQIANRRWFDETLQRHLDLAKRARYPIGVLMIDIDDFKSLNDRYGHVEGDRCLVAVAREISKLVNRVSDLVARYGGEEFVCILPDTDIEGVRRIGQTILDAVRALRIPHEFSRAANILTVSAGGVSIVPDVDMSSDDILRQVDMKMYQSKNSGRNQLTV